MRSPGRLVGQRELLQAVWGPAHERETTYLQVHLAQLRRKLEPDPAHPRYLLTEPGMGHRFLRVPPAQAGGGPLQEDHQPPISTR